MREYKEMASEYKSIARLTNPGMMRLKNILSSLGGIHIEKTRLLDFYSGEAGEIAENIVTAIKHINNAHSEKAYRLVSLQYLRDVLNDTFKK